MKSEPKNPWITHSSEIRYANPWIELTHREVTTPGGSDGIYGVVHFKNLAIGVIPLDDEGNTWLVGQYRYTLNAYSWEIPEGGCPVGTDPLDTAKRELLEETGITASNWTQLLDLHTSNSVTDEYGIAYVATGLAFGKSAPEDTEKLVVRKIPISQAFDMAMKGEITDVLSLAALFKLQILMLESKYSDKLNHILT